MVRWSMLLVVLMAVAVFRFENMAANLAPPGSDYGNWLAFGRQLAGQDVKAARAVYPPIAPMISWGLAAVAGPLAAGKILGTLTSVLSGIPLYLIGASEAPWGLALLGTAAFVATGYRSEVVAFGGYPQLLAEAFALGALSLYAAGAARGRPAVIAVAAVLASLVVGTHHLTSIVLFAALPLCTVALIAQGVPGRRAFRALLWLGTVSAILALPYATTYVTMLKEVAGSPFNTQGWTIATAGETFAYVFRNSVGLWYGLLGVAVVALLLPGSRRRPLLWAMTIVFLVVPLSLFLINGEVRFLQFLFPGIMLGFILAGAALWEAPDAGSRARRVLLATVMIAGVSGTIWGGVQFTRQAFPWYQVVDDRRLEALDWLRSNTPEDALIASTATRNGWALGWWIEGYAGRKTFSGGDLRWMAFREEKQQTRFANTVFELLSAGDPHAEVLAANAGLSYLIIDKEYWKLPLGRNSAQTVFENEVILIIKVPGRTSRLRCAGSEG